MLIALRVHGTGQRPLPACEIKFLRAGNVLKTTGDQHQSAGQWRRGVRFALYVQRTSVRPDTCDRIINLGAPRRRLAVCPPTTSTLPSVKSVAV